MEYVENLIAIEIEKLPDTVQKALWWQTDKGKDAMFDAEWCYRYGEPFEPYWFPAEDDKIQALSDLILQALSTKAVLEAEAAAFRDDEDDDTEEPDE